MSRIFISHSSKNNDKAKELHNWLADNGWNDVFFDLHPHDGIAPGQRWRERLTEEAHRCQAILLVVTPEWLASKNCTREMSDARVLGKQIIPLLYSNIPIQSLPHDITAVQILNMYDDNPDRWERLKDGLGSANLDADSFKFEPPDRCPYPGLRALTEDDAAIFFGREAQTVRGLDRLRKMRIEGLDRLFIIEGASGAGKSSFLRAGLWPRLKRDDRNFLALPVIRPERAVLTGDLGLIPALEKAFGYDSIANRLNGRKVTRAKITKRLDEDPDGLLKILHFFREAASIKNIDGSPGTPPLAILPIDQGEELFTGYGTDESDRFIELLADTMTRDPHFIAIIAMRSDAYPLLTADQRLAGFHNDTFKLPPMSKGTFKSVIEGPANVRQPKLKIDPSLTEKLLDDAKGDDALPLLAFTLERLYINHGSDDDLTLNEYTAMGGLTGAIEASVDEALENAKLNRDLPTTRWELEVLLRSTFISHLVDINEADQFIRRIVPLDEIPQEAHPLIELLVAQHLLTSSRRNVAGVDVKMIEVAQEALLREWPLLKRWLEDQKDALRAASSIKRAAREWNNNERSDDWLEHIGARLEIAVALAERDDIRARIGSLGEDYLQAAHAKLELENRKREAQRQREASLEYASARKGQFLTAALIVIPLIITAAGIVGRELLAHANRTEDFAAAIDKERATAVKISVDLAAANAKLVVRMAVLKGGGYVHPGLDQYTSYQSTYATPHGDIAENIRPVKDETSVDTASATETAPTSKVSAPVVNERRKRHALPQSTPIEIAANVIYSSSTIVIDPKLGDMVVTAFSGYSLVAAAGTAESAALVLKPATFLLLDSTTFILPNTKTSNTRQAQNQNNDDIKIIVQTIGDAPFHAGTMDTKPQTASGPSDPGLLGTGFENAPTQIARSAAPPQQVIVKTELTVSQVSCVAAADNLLTPLTGLSGMAILSKFTGC